MRLSDFTGKGTVAAAILIMSLWMQTAFAGTHRPAEVRIENQSVTVSTTISGATYLLLRIMGPSGNHIGDWQTTGAPVTWALPEQAENGLYRYELRVGTTPRKARTADTNTAPAAREHVESGVFRVTSGTIVILDPTAEETGMIDNLGTQALTAVVWVLDAIASPAHADQVILDDAIITGSECIGNDCNNGESFDFDTLRIKENNLRIHFQDTSNSASFPQNDWRILINDTANGGANFFGIEDSSAARRPFTIEAGAPSNGLYLSATGNLGLGTATPLTDLHLVTGNTPTVRLEQNGANGFAPYTWDLSGNENRFFLRNVTTQTSPLVIDAATGAMGLGTLAPRAALEIQQTFKNADLLLSYKDVTKDGEPEVITKIEASDTAARMGSASSHPLQLMAASQPFVTLTPEGRLGIGTTTPSDTLHVTGNAFITGNLELGSSRTLKFNITPLAPHDAEAALTALEPVRYRYKSDPDEESLGFIAEDVPDLVATNTRKSVSPMDIVAVLARVVKDQQETLATQQKAIDALQKRLDALAR
ncbi:tail fiber domain-containing protein [Desulfoluna sp.]|uniref:tail fiber domain-containing protein n=1 Tax=Desulfoluna sp. TaxID=2045199 RepID=UPI002638AD11|nr:tail fiber domain-containing protein [Desulfoluna sp.]